MTDSLFSQRLGQLQVEACATMMGVCFAQTFGQPQDATTTGASTAHLLGQLQGEACAVFNGWIGLTLSIKISWIIFFLLSV